MRWTLGLALLLAGCSGDADTDGETGATDDSGEQTAAYDCEAASWDDDRGADYMTNCVLPTMAAVFEAYDADAYGDLSCASCHGDNAGGSYEMPGATPISVRQQDPNSDIYQFMNGTVVPEMADLLGREPFDPSTGQGDFSCYDCHIEAR